MKTEIRGAKTINDGIPQWWLEVPEAEKAVIRGLVSSVRVLKRSKSPQVGQAARKWERSITCFIKFRLMGCSQKLKAETLKR